MEVVRSVDCFVDRLGISYPIESNLRADTTVTQLAMVPLQDFHSGNDIIEGDRMLMVSGDLDTSVGNVSAALYDGQTLFPYIISSTGAGSPGSISSLFHSFSSFSFSKRSKPSSRFHHT